MREHVEFSSLLWPKSFSVNLEVGVAPDNQETVACRPIIIVWFMEIVKWRLRAQLKKKYRMCTNEVLTMSSSYRDKIIVQFNIK